MSKPCYVILGAGISGLALAWQLQKLHPQADVHVLEKSARIGGWIETRHRDGFLFEMGPHSIRAKGKGFYTLKLVEELGMQEEVIAPNPAAKRRYLYQNKKLIPLPHNVPSMLFSGRLSLLLQAAWQDWRTPPAICADESIYDFGCRHFGKEFTEQMLDPLTWGIFAGNCRNLSVQACFPEWVQDEGLHGSLLKAAWRRKRPALAGSEWISHMQKEAIFSFRQGIGSLVEALSRRIKNICLGTHVINMRFEPEGIQLELSSQQKLWADHVFSTLPPVEIGKLLPIPEWQIPYATVGVVAAGFHAQAIPKEGFGYLVPTREKESILGMVWDSSVFPEQNKPGQARLTVMIEAKEPKDLKSIALDAMARHLHIKACPDSLEVKIAHSAIPHYPLGYKQHRHMMLQLIDSLSPHLTLLGTAFHGVSVNDCIAQAFYQAGQTEFRNRP